METIPPEQPNIEYEISSLIDDTKKLLTKVDLTAKVKRIEAELKILEKKLEENESEQKRE